MNDEDAEYQAQLELVRALGEALMQDDEFWSHPDILDMQAEHAKEVVSDEKCKIIQYKMRKGMDVTPEEIMFLASLAGKSKSGYGPDDEADWEDGMLEEYAEHLRNYRYTYKDEAQEIDPEIDPEEEHRGPMAQHIEQVAPDCVNETEEGVKTVDGNRLALVNAGVIGALARRLLKLERAVGV